MLNYLLLIPKIYKNGKEHEQGKMSQRMNVKADFTKMATMSNKATSFHVYQPEKYKEYLTNMHRYLYLRRKNIAMGVPEYLINIHVYFFYSRGWENIARGFLRHSHKTLNWEKLPTLKGSTNNPIQKTTLCMIWGGEIYQAR